MLRTKIFKGFVLIIAIFSILSLAVGVRLLRKRVIEEAATRVRMDLSSAWAVYNGKIEQVETIIKLVAAKEIVVDSCAAGDWANVELKTRLERIRSAFNLDFLDIVAPDGKVMLRSAPPYAVGDFLPSDAAIERAKSGEPVSCTMLMSGDQLAKEGEGLAERAYLELEETPRARKTCKQVEDRGMVMVTAVPVRRASSTTAIVYGGILLNRNWALIDRIQEVVFKRETHEGMSVGTATIFLHDSRIATTVKQKNGNRAIGTRVSKEVADSVLDNARPWTGKAFVVNDTYLTAYDPIKDGRGAVIGMLYVGILKSPFDQMERNTILIYLLVSTFVLVVAVVLSFVTAGRLAAPIRRLMEASERYAGGCKPVPVEVSNTCRETEQLTSAFNRMISALCEREDKLKSLNRNYMETLGFVSHELKGPVATIINYIFLLKSKKLGELTEKQEKAVMAIDRNSGRLVDMVRHYLNLSRIENKELVPAKMNIAVEKEVVAPLVDAFEPAADEKGISIDVRIDPDTVINADLSMAREVFENVIGNAVKYGAGNSPVVIESARENGMVEFRVKNRGEGIPADKMPCLFQKFVRLDQSPDGKARRGTGLGLFITKHIIEAHGGSIEAKSDPAGWTEFAFTFPAGCRGGSGAAAVEAGTSGSGR